MRNSSKLIHYIIIMICFFFSFCWYKLWNCQQSFYNVTHKTGSLQIAQIKWYLSGFCCLCCWFFVKIQRVFQCFRELNSIALKSLPNWSRAGRAEPNQNKNQTKPSQVKSSQTEYHPHRKKKHIIREQLMACATSACSLYTIWRSNSIYTGWKLSHKNGI